MASSTQGPNYYITAIRKSGLDIYAPIEIGDPDLWIPTPVLEQLLDQALRGRDLTGLPLRTRSRVVKEIVCRALGYPVPRSFHRPQPRFPGQQFDTYIQKSNNLQVWNEELSPSRRYVLIRVSANDTIQRVRVVMGEALARLDTTGTLTHKYQAQCHPGERCTELCVASDTLRIAPFVSEGAMLELLAPTARPAAGELLPISRVHERLSTLVGDAFPNPGPVQERTRGAELHRRACQALGYLSYRDAGRFPDIPHQLIEVKLQTSPTIDLGLVRPDSTDPLDLPHVGGVILRHCDVRYAVFCATSAAEDVLLSHLIVTTGERFFQRFPQFQGKVLNRKLQIPLPADFFEG